MNPPTAPDGRSTLHDLDAHDAPTEPLRTASRGATPSLRVVPDAHAPRGPRTLRTEPTFVVGSLHTVTAAVFRRILPELRGGTLVVSAPDGTRHRFGTGPEQHLVIDDWRALQRVALRGSMGFGEGYTAGEWHTDDLPGLLDLLLSNADAAVERHSAWWRLLEARPRPNRRSGWRAARRRIAYHYDLGNDLFELFLDPTMTYSCARFERPNEPLEDAQRRKQRMLCDALDLRPGDELLEIGCGWGSFAITAALEYGVRVTGLTLSHEQAELARSRVAAAGVTDRVDIVETDYRNHRGQYDAIASFEMIEAIGEAQLPTFFTACDRFLRPGGRAGIQAILVPDHRWDRYRKSADWMERYVFPGCCIPSVGALVAASAAASTLKLSTMEEFGADYAPTLAAWRRAFFDHLDEVRALGYDDRFIRTWDLYLAFSEATFRQRRLRDAQLVFTR